jgi:hypothetical protein
VVAVGISNQRETTILWDKLTGKFLLFYNDFWAEIWILGISINTATALLIY